MGKKGFRMMQVILLVLTVLCGCGSSSFTKEDVASKWADSLWMDAEENVTGLLEGEGSDERKAPEFEEAGPTPYAYQGLSEAEASWYQDINRALGGLLKKQELSLSGLKAGLDEEDIDKVFACVLDDHPEYFYVEGYTYTKYTRLDRTVKLEFSGAYSMGIEEARRRKGQIDLAAGELLAGVEQDASDYEKVKYVYETLIRNTEYDLDAPDNQNIYSVFVNHASVCQGYAKATQYLLHRLGVECALVMGTVDEGEGHAWNLVRVDGAYYYVDTTWGDASYRAGWEDSSFLPEVSYDYLCVTTDQLSATHRADEVIPLPECESLDANYYVREGAYFTEYDEEKLKRLFASYAEAGRRDVTLKCGDASVYQEMEDHLITGQDVFRYMDGGDGRIAYARNDSQFTLTFWVTNE